MFEKNYFFVLQMLTAVAIPLETGLVTTLELAAVAATAVGQEEVAGMTRASNKTMKMIWTLLNPIPCLFLLLAITKVLHL